MKIDRKLNLIFELDVGDAGSAVYAHSSPIEEAVWETYYGVLAKTLGSLYSDDFNPSLASRLTLLRLREVAKDMGGDTKLQEVESGLIAEIERRTNIVLLDEKQGWTPIPLSVAAQRDLISKGDWKEVLSQAIFFTAVSWVHTRGELEKTVLPMMKIYNARTESSNATEYARSLPMSTPAESTGEKAAPSSTPV